MTNVIAATGPEAPEEYIKALEPSNPEKPVRYNPDRWDADIEIIDSNITRIRIGKNGGILIDFYIRFRVDLTVEIPYMDYNRNEGVLGFPYYCYEYAFSIWSYDPQSHEPVKRLLGKKIEFNIFALLLETDHSLRKVGPVSSLDQIYKYGDNGSVSVHWVSKDSLNARTAEELRSVAENKGKYVAKGVLELVGRNVPLTLSGEEQELVKTTGIYVKVYGGVMLWSMPGSSTPGGTSIIAWSSFGPLIIRTVSPEHAATSTTPLVSAGAGLEKGLENKEFIYDMSIGYELRQYTGGEETGRSRVNIYFKHVISLGGISNGYVDVKGTIEGLETDSTDPEAESMIMDQLEALEFENRIHVSQIADTMKALIESYTAFETQYQLEGLNYRIEPALYMGIPAIKLNIYGEGPAYLSGAEEASYKLNLTAYYDEYLGMPLEIKAHLWLRASAGDQTVDGTISFNSTIISGIDALPRINVKPGIIVEFEGKRGLLKFTAENAEISSLDVSGNTLTVTISGDGIGSMLIEVPGEVYVDDVTVDGEPVNYTILASTPEKTVILVPVLLSQHMLSIRFSETPAKARIVDMISGEEYTETTITPTTTSPITQSSTPATLTVVTGTHSTTTSETSTRSTNTQTTQPTGTVNPLELFGGMWLYIVIAVIIVAVIGGLVALLRRGRKPRQPYYYPPTPPPPPPPG